MESKYGAQHQAALSGTADRALGYKMSEKSEQFDVAVVGYGPAGAALANILERQGMSVIVIEQFPQSYLLPRATHLDGESMRILQSVGIATALAPKLGTYFRMRFEDSDGNLLLDWPRSRAPGIHGWYDSNRFHQPDLEAALQARVAKSPRVSVRRGWRVTSLTQDDTGVLLAASNEPGETLNARARFVVGCDGARSTVRSLIGGEVSPLAPPEQWLVVDFTLQPGAPELPEGTVQYCDPKRPVTYIEGAGKRRRWEIMLLPGDDPATFADPENVYRLLARWISPKDVELERAVVYSFGSAVSTRWRDNRIFIAGDAAHLTPPFLGQGLCSGLRDIINLAWKLDWTLAGRAAPGLLDSYQQEVEPQVSQYIGEANRIGAIIQVRDPEKARKRDAMLRSDPRSLTSIKPRLGGDLWGQKAPPLAGTLAPQPKLLSGALMDEVVGLRFALLARPGVLARLGSASLARWQSAQGVLLEGDGQDYLDSLGVEAVLIRPDHYLFGTARSAVELEALIDALPLAAS